MPEARERESGLQKSAAPPPVDAKLKGPGVTANQTGANRRGIGLTSRTCIQMDRGPRPGLYRLGRRALHNKGRRGRHRPGHQGRHRPGHQGRHRPRRQGRHGKRRPARHKPDRQEQRCRRRRDRHNRGRRARRRPDRQDRHNRFCTLRALASWRRSRRTKARQQSVGTLASPVSSPDQTLPAGPSLLPPVTGWMTTQPPLERKVVSPPPCSDFRSLLTQVGRNAANPAVHPRHSS